MSRESPWPNLFVVGAGRAGTTSLWRSLDEHPDIFMARFKEPHFFSGHTPPLSPVVHDEAAYLRLFAGAREALRGEASTSYLRAQPAAARIKRASPEAKIVIMVRDPVDRSRSWYWRQVGSGGERASFAEAVATELETGFPVERSKYVWNIRYSSDVRRFLDVFEANVRVVVLEDLIRDPRRTLTDLFVFVGADPAPAHAIRLGRHNPFALPRDRIAGGLLGSARARAFARAVVPSSLRDPIERRLVKSGPAPPIDPETEHRLTEFFEPDVRELAEVLGRPLPWPRWLEPSSPTTPVSAA